MPRFIPPQVFWFERTTQPQREVLRSLNEQNNLLGLSTADIRDFIDRLLMLEQGVDIDDTALTPIIMALYQSLFGQAEVERIFAPYE